jgi:ribosomal peptide maturation radical SAM protein 1
MPWASLDRPSLALALLAEAAEASGEVERVDTLHANLQWARWLLDLDEPIGPAEFDDYGLENYFLGFGDWVFTSALYGQPWKVVDFKLYAEASGQDPSAAVRLHGLAPSWIDGIAAEIVRTYRPDVVGFTTTFQQTIASLALARAIKAIDPTIVTVMGGANCDGDQGAAVQRNFSDIIDFVVRGEGELAFPSLLRGLQGHGHFGAVPGLCWTSSAGAATNAMAKETIDLSTVGPPRYDEYFDRLAEAALHEYVIPHLVLESSRGCWWGQKHHCTFCGLNGTYMTYRAKDQDQFLAEVKTTVERYRVLDIYVVDNILDMRYFQRCLPALAALGWDLHIQYEIKSSLRRHQLEALRDAGAHSVQPGIESLDSRVLKLMDKGVKGPQNVRLLREGKNVGIDVSWNYLYGFPGESDDDYVPVVDQIPALHHLQPPRVASPIAVERFSPYFSKPELGFAEIVPAEYYGLLFDLPIEELFDLAYIFDAHRQGVVGELERRLVEATDEWRDSFYTSRFVEWDLDETIVLLSERAHIPWSTRTLTDEAEKAVYRRLHEPASKQDLLAEGVGGMSEARLDALLAEWVHAGVVFHNKGQYVTIATEPNGIEIISNSRRALEGVPA